MTPRIHKIPKNPKPTFSKTRVLTQNFLVNFGQNGDWVLFLSYHGSFKLHSMHQLHARIKRLEGFWNLGQKPPISNGHNFKKENAQNACTHNPWYDPSSQPSQLECKMQEISKILSQTLKLRKLEKLGEKIFMPLLILENEVGTLQIFRDLAENQCRSV